MDRNLLEVRPVGQEVVDAGGAGPLEGVVGRARCRGRLEPEEIVVEGVDQVEVDGILDDGVADAHRSARTCRVDVRTHGIPLSSPDLTEPKVRGCEGRSGPIIGTSCSPAPGRAMSWWATDAAGHPRRTPCRPGAGRWRWYRCLRCDAWVAGAAPEEPTRDRVPSRDEIELPARGPALRDRYVLRLIALDRAIHVIVLSALAVVLFTFANHDTSLHRDYVNIMNDLSGGAPGESEVRGVLGYLRKAFKYSPQH